ncbi:MAG TPA: ATP-grasp domain-containing protein [Solirubrobacteraceae bacterium]|nr:ATP-grasp domain-containing protein [Solirubrobacteraceae bacterium]
MSRAPIPKPPYRVLVLAGGTEIGLEIRRSLRDLKEVRLVGAGSADDRHGPFAYRTWELVRPVQEDGWLEELCDVIDRHRVDFVFAGHDDVLLALAEHADSIPACVVTSPARTCRVARSKRATYELLGDALPVPRTFAHADEVDSFPVFVKPDRSHGSRGAVEVRDRDELLRCVAAGSDLIMELLPGEEVTVDCFSDRERGLLFARARPRLRTRAGISMSSCTAGTDEPLVRVYAEAITSRLALHGAWFFQLRRDRDGVPRLLEVAPRVAGTSAVHRVTGINFALLSIYEALRVPLQVATNAVSVQLDRALVNRYRHDLSFSAVYVDLDDTLIVDGAVNVRLVAFLYQCLNEGRRLVLLTRHRGDLAGTLRRMRLHGLWDEVVQLAEHERKSDAIREADALLIDDSFSERRAAAQALGIATFDASMLELLLDDRV